MLPWSKWLARSTYKQRYNKYFMYYKVLGRLSVAMSDLVDEIKLESLRHWEELQKHNKSVRPSRAYVTHFRNAELVSKLRTSVFPAGFDNNQMQLAGTQVFVAPPHTGMPIHKDGASKKSALNIIVQGTEQDWTRWYSDELINNAGGKVANTFDSAEKRKSRNIGNLPRYPTLPYTDQLTGLMLLGTVYLVNTDIYHAFFNNSDDYRIVLQTNFAGNPSIEQLSERIQQTGLLNVNSIG
jgi:hypothetical protein